MAKEMTAAERVMAAYSGRVKNPKRVSAGAKGFLGKVAAMTLDLQHGVPYVGKSWTDTSAGAAVGAMGSGAEGMVFSESDAEGAFTGGKNIQGNIGKSFKDLIKKYPALASFAGIIFAQYLASSAANTYNDVASSGIETAGLQAQGDAMTPESFYNRQMLPQAQEQERIMQALLMGKIAGGGVLGPSLAKGEYSIGG